MIIGLLRRVPILLLVLLATPRFSLGVRVIPAERGWGPEQGLSCSGGQACEFQDPTGSNVYFIERGVMTRKRDGVRVYSRPIVGKHEEVVNLAMSRSANELAIVIARQFISARAFIGGGFHPSDVERSHRCVIVNPKSGEEIKSIDLGSFRPSAVSLSTRGELVILLGQDLQLKRRAIQILNARNGKLEFEQTIPDGVTVSLGVDGFSVNGEGWRVSQGAAKENSQTFLSKNPYSIAEYDVSCSSSLAVRDYEQMPFAIVEFVGASGDVNQMLSTAAAVKLKGAGVSVVERQRMAEVLQELSLQGSGLTEHDRSVKIGELSNARYLVFGELLARGTTSSLTMRLVSVESGGVVSACESTCRDCREDDYVESLDFLINTWVK